MWAGRWVYGLVKLAISVSYIDLAPKRDVISWVVQGWNIPTQEASKHFYWESIWIDNSSFQ